MLAPHLTPHQFAVRVIVGSILFALLISGLCYTAFGATPPLPAVHPDYGKIADTIESGDHRKIVQSLAKNRTKHWPPELDGIRRACRTQAIRSMKSHDAFSGGVIKAAAPVGPLSIDNEPEPANPATFAKDACTDLRKLARKLAAILAQ